MNPADDLKAIASRLPDCSPQVTELLSGTAFLDLTLNGVRFCAEYLVEFKAFGLSKTEDASPFTEGVDESFSSSDQLERRIMELLNVKS